MDKNKRTPYPKSRVRDQSTTKDPLLKYTPLKETAVSWRPAALQLDCCCGCETVVTALPFTLTAYVNHVTPDQYLTRPKRVYALTSMVEDLVFQVAAMGNCTCSTRHYKDIPPSIGHEV